MSQNHFDSSDTAVVESPDVPQESRRHRFYANLRAFLSRFFALAFKPKSFAPLIVDYWLFLQSIWRGRQQGPDLVYPMLSIRKRQSGRLARLISEHCRAVRQYELRVGTPFPESIDPPCVAVIDLDEVPQEVIQKGYSTQVDLYGLMCMLILFETMITLILQACYIFDWGWVSAAVNWTYCTVLILVFCGYAVESGDGSLTLAQRSDTSTSGCVVLLDQDFTVVLNGNQSVVEAIAGSSLSLSHANSVGMFVDRSLLEDLTRDSSYELLRTRYSLSVLWEDFGEALSESLLEALCEAACFTFFTLCYLLLRPTTPMGTSAPLIVVIILAHLIPAPQRLALFPRLRLVAWLMRTGVRVAFPLIFLSIYTQTPLPFVFIWHYLSLFLFCLVFYWGTGRNYPIRSAKLLDALGHPQVRKWQFDTLAVATTFQCLVLCRRIPRPIRSIDVLPLLDMLIPDQRDLWMAWKARVADRIVHETDISFTPTIPMFRDERQEHLKDLLDQAQFGYDTYRSFYDWHVPLHPLI
ncbi:hypothetical protein OG21DRAFT_1496566 [Imleria badia]|nr:hypothetical protein OG21DRAFT_1496566 [Imleria badia]